MHMDIHFQKHEREREMIFGRGLTTGEVYQDDWKMNIG